MRIAISTDDKKGLESTASHHFGRCPCYVFVDFEGAEVKAVQSVDNPFYEKHEPGQVPGFINENGVNVMISGGMGRRAIDFFDQFGIQVATGANGKVAAVIQAYLDGKLSGAAPCIESVSNDC